MSIDAVKKNHTKTFSLRKKYCNFFQLKINMEVSSSSEKILRNLGVISALTQNDKINTKDELFSVYVPTTFRGLHRSYYGEGRELNIMKIQNCIRDAKNFISNTLSEIKNGNGREEVSFMHRMNLASQNQLCTRMMDSLKNCQDGLSALQVTYKDDASICTQLVIMINEISDFLLTVKQYSLKN
tara:strand:- start:710 stop:1261 length:552 start_codon:yes stop_codon:yes gene_type:complete